MYNKVKKQNGEKFAQALRAANNGIFEIPEINLILRHAGRDTEDSLKLIPYLMSLLEIDNTPVPNECVIEDPLTLLDRAGYNAFHADTLEKQNSIERYFENDELLCTFNDRVRYKDYYIIHAVKKMLMILNVLISEVRSDAKMNMEHQSFQFKLQRMVAS